MPSGSAALVYNTRFDGRRPDAVVHVRDTADVAAAVRWANRFDVPARRALGRPQLRRLLDDDATAWCSTCRPCAACGVSGGRATVGPAAKLIDVQRALTRRGVTVPVGLVPDGRHRRPRRSAAATAWPGRRFGLTSDNLVAARIVTADGRVRHVDAGTNEDLYWACRGGGGGNFGVVTSLTLTTHRVSRAAYFFVSWPWSQASEAIAAWQRFAPHAPRALTSILSLGTTGGSGSPRVSALGQYFGSEAALRRLVRPLTRVGRRPPQHRHLGYFTMVLRWAGCLDGGLSACHRSTRSSFYAKSDYFDRPVGPRGRARMIDWIERRQRTPSLGSGALLLDAYGGALNRPAAGRDGVRAPRHALLAPVPRLLRRRGRRAREQAVDQRRLARAPAARLGRGVPELHRPGPRPLAARLLRRRTSHRLREIKKQVDPDFRFRFPQAIPPAR